jgi:hypothetical protein
VVRLTAVLDCGIALPISLQQLPNLVTGAGCIHGPIVRLSSVEFQDFNLGTIFERALEVEPLSRVQNDGRNVWMCFDVSIWWSIGIGVGIGVSHWLNLLQPYLAGRLRQTVRASTRKRAGGVAEINRRRMMLPG